ncbi:heavy metal translocating P-type ATPase [Staphylococcus simiae]|uniref:heavy metal translocating P-type ATPase n=1 Tax=Staphylococcus simiae TaxID=308354 RepID=UPI001A96A6C6|nr:heavy metal translocating P-type ATPase [Staphylococcus simiae]MBO1199853.1 heavy metal translocating P-type ATPase [Staphylococcus simiae]MBO1202226.1 heavy metal translocating P-type ATPase [Staphylococcus simiae]MBO1204485.1 heavy metal translocating P-type ATPase [Staphylococcus simiae]MBO1211912.1 heavy metal translocating P-type ATPase [Staphylococcus simiae]MBO1230670.1 heavy metal translocating P-type ATPase [Staphylococcus simiae]
MQRFILKHKATITWVNAILIIIAMITNLLFKLVLFSNIVMLIAGIIGVLPIALQAYQSIKIRVLSIDVLVTIAVIGAIVIRNYEEAAVVTFLFLFGSYLEQKTMNKTRRAIKELTDLEPQTAMKLVDNRFKKVDIFDVTKNDILQVKTGERLPVDGTIVNGSGVVNEASITGESKGIYKSENDTVLAGTILENGILYVQTDKVGEETAFGKIIELVENAQDSKSQAERFIDQFAKYYTPLILIMSIVVYIISRNIELAITVLVLGCPGALVIGVPVSNVAGIGNGARHGILLKGAEIIRSLSKVDTMIFDKTGTLTEGQPKVHQQYNYSSQIHQALQYLKSIEIESNHPLANAIVDYLDNIETVPINHMNVVRGQGIEAQVNGDRVYVGNKQLMKEHHINFPTNSLQHIDELESLGHSIVMVAINNQLCVTLGIKDKVRLDIKQQLKQMSKLGIKQLVVLSGDNQTSVDIVAKELGLTTAIGNMFPKDKADYVQKLKDQGHVVAFVGDGINDSPSIAIADIGIAVGSGTDVAIDTSDVVLVKSDFKHLNHAIKLSKKTNRNMIENIMIAVSTVIFLLIALFTSHWLTMSVGMFVHEASILIVILNAMRLLKFGRT